MNHFSKYSTVILANGEMPTHELPLQLLRDAKHLICCDGAIDKLAALHLQPSVVIGDFDSISEENRARYRSLLVEDKDVEICDLHKAIRYAIQHYDGAIAIVGATGLREDHALSNISLLMTYAPQREMVMVTNYGVFYPACQTITLPSQPGQQVSIFSFTPETKLTFHNLRYPVSRRSFHHFWEGALNEALGEEFTVEFEKGEVLVFVEMRDERGEMRTKKKI